MHMDPIIAVPVIFTAASRSLSEEEASIGNDFGRRERVALPSVCGKGNMEQSQTRR